MSVIGWARVSSEAQCLDGQIKLLEESRCEKIFASKHSGKGKGKNIEKLEALIEFVREGDVVLVTKLDRLGRSVREVLQTVETLREKKVALKCLEQPVDTTNDDVMSTAMLTMLSLFAQMEHQFIKERTQAGKERTGNFGGRKPKLTKEQREEIRKSIASGTSQYSLAKKYSVTPTTIHRIKLECVA